MLLVLDQGRAIQSHAANRDCVAERRLIRQAGDRTQRPVLCRSLRCGDDELENQLNQLHAQLKTEWGRDRSLFRPDQEAGGD